MSTTETKGYLGFSNLPNQVNRKSAKRGFEFSLMVVGESGLGKSTLVNCLFRTNLYKDRKILNAEELVNSSVTIAKRTVDIEEKGVKLKLTVVDTPGFGDGIDSSQCFDPIIKYIDEQFENFLRHESGVNRRHINDSRIHCCFYFISPIGYGLKPIDIKFMELLHKRVNIIPIIGKADALTTSELNTMKRRILEDIEKHHINIYTIPDCDSDEDEDYKEQIRVIKGAVPFAVSSSLDKYESKGRKSEGRQYPWGLIETENPDHSDFVKLRALLVTHMQDLREVTQDVHYENYRSMRLTSGDSNDYNDNNAEEINGQDKILLEKEAELKRMKDMLSQMQMKMKMQQNDV